MGYVLWVALLRDNVFTENKEKRMKKYISLIAILLLLLIYSNLLADEDIYVEVYNYTGYEIIDCNTYVNSTPENGPETLQPGYNDFYVSVPNPEYAHVNVFGFADIYGYDGIPADGQGNTYFDGNQWRVYIGLNSQYLPLNELAFNISIINSLDDDAHNCNLIRNPGAGQEILFYNQTISTGTTNYTQYEIWIDDDLLVEGGIDGFYAGQVYDVSDLEIVDYDMNWGALELEIFADLDLEYDDIPPDYDYNVTNLSSSGWNWVSFPVLDPDYDDPIDYVLEPILDDLVEVLHDEDRIYKVGNEWINQIGDFRSVDGYKIDMDDAAELEVAGWVEEPSTVMYLDEDVSKGPWNPMLGIGNWIGCFVPGSHLWQTAFSQIMDEITFIKSDDWSYVKGYSVPSSFCTVDYGKLYVVGVSEDCSFTWTTFGKGYDPYEKPETIIFTYEEEADYMPIFVDDTDALDGVDEIGVFLCEECIGASVIEEFPVFIPAYVEDTLIKEDVELTFRTAYYDDKSIMKNMSVFVYDEKEKDFIEDIVVLDNMYSALIKLGIGEDVEFPTEFSVHQNYPNPVRGTTTISFTLPEGHQEAQVMIYNIKGQLVKELEVSVSNKGFNAVWDCTDENSKPVSNGIYFYKVTSGTYSEMKKMLIAQ